MSIEKICEKLMSNVPKAVAGGVVDMGTGMLLDVKTTDSHPSAVLDLLAAATKDLFEGDLVMDIEAKFRKSRGDQSKDHYFQEIIVNSKNLIHVFGRLPSQPSIVACVVCRASANLGLVVTQFRTSVGSV